MEDESDFQTGKYSDDNNCSGSSHSLYVVILSVTVTLRIETSWCYLSERLNYNLYYTLGKLILQFGCYIYFLSALFSAVRREIGQVQSQEKEYKFPNSKTFHFFESSRSSQRILLALGLLLFFHCRSFTQ